MMEDIQAVKLPTYLRRQEPMEADDLPLQVALLTMHAAELHLRLTAAAHLLTQAATLLLLPGGGLFPDE